MYTKTPASPTAQRAHAQFQCAGDSRFTGADPRHKFNPGPLKYPVPFRDYLGYNAFRLDTIAKSQWFLRAAIDNYTQHNSLVQQAALPSTGAESHNNYMNLVISDQYAFSPNWLGSFVFAAGGLHLTETRNSDMGLHWPFRSRRRFETVSGFETFGDNQFQTSITNFPVLRNQEKYQFRYDVTHSSGEHAPRVGLSFIHEPVLSGALSGTAETLLRFPTIRLSISETSPSFNRTTTAGSVVYAGK